jgi:energy-coupling factor transporter ATP-binding protein EcfA2/energy-coupling factor transporter transmembrane protein EcfT
VSALAAEALGWTWADGRVALDGVELVVRPGERVLVTGPSGCGKSTLIRLAAGLLPGHGAGERCGSLRVAGSDPAGWTGSERAARVGLVFQEPGDQLVTGRAADEVAFGAISAGRTADVPGWLARVGLPIDPDHPPGELSGGQQQRLAVAAALAGGAGLLLLDEPLAHLDPDGAAELLSTLAELAAEGRAVVLVEHRLEDTIGWADRVVVLRAGRVVWDGPDPPSSLLSGDGLCVPAWRRVLDGGGLDAFGPVALPARTSGSTLLRFTAAELRQGDRAVLRDVDLVLHAGERVALVGRNGAGKSTLLSALAVAAGGRAVHVPQDPDLALFCATVGEELAYGPTERGVPPAVGPADLGLDGLLERAPQALSRGQRLRVAVAAAAAVGPELLLLDEPTAGQHADAVQATLRAVVAARPDGAMVFATHDAALALAFADRVIVLGEGRILDDGPPERALLGLPLPPLQRAQAERGWPLADVERQLAGPYSESSGEPVFFHVPPSAAQAVPVVATGPRAPMAGSYAALCGVAGTGALAVLLDRPASLVLLASIAMAALLSRPLPLRTRVRALGVAVAVVWSTMLSQGLFYGDLPRTSLVSWGPFVVWREGLIWGLLQSLRLVAVGAAGLALALTTSPDRLLGLLRGVGVPGGLAFLAMTALRFVPVVAGEWLVVRAARAQRGRPLHHRAPWAWLGTELLLLRPLVARSLRRARHLAEALESRGFEPRNERGPVPTWTRTDRLTAMAVGGAVAAVAGAQAITGLYLWDVARHPSLNPLYAWVRAWL